MQHRLETMDGRVDRSPKVSWLAVAFVLLWILFTILPLYLMAITALKSAAEAGLSVPTLWPKQWFPQNFAAVLTQPSSLAALKHSFIIASGNSAISIVLGALAGYALARHTREAGGENLAFWILSNRMLPPAAALIAMFSLLKTAPGGTDNLWSLMILYLGFNLPLGTWLMMVFFRDVPRELEEAASLDGWTPLGAFLRITFPLVLPGMITATALCWIFAWNEYLLASLFAGATVRTLTIAIPRLTEGFEPLWNLPMAFSLIAMMPPVVLFVLLRRHMVRGLSLGFVKA
jgi:multiple sugar transport system permease protein